MRRMVSGLISPPSRMRMMASRSASIRSRRQLRQAAGDHARPGGHQGGAFVEGERTPPVRSVPGAVHRGLHVSCCLDGPGGDDVTGDRVERVEGLGRVARRGCLHVGGGHRALLMRSAAFSAIMMVGAFVLPRGTAGITEAFTGNDTENGPMLAINRWFGYRPAATEWRYFLRQNAGPGEK